MGEALIRAVLHNLRAHLGPADADVPCDAELLETFLSGRDPAAFAALVRRHGPMVWGVCRRALHDDHDAEDAFQAVFLVLLRKSPSLRRRDLLSSWLYAVALRTARKARSLLLRRQGREEPLGDVPARDEVPALIWQEVRCVIDEEIGLLPEKYRAPVVLHHLEGLSKQATARSLGWPEGTVSARLARAREVLRRRLARRGLSLSVAGIGVALAHGAAQAVSPALASSTVACALQPMIVPMRVEELTREVLRAMSHAPLKTVLTFVLAACLAGVATALCLSPAALPEPRQSKGADEPRPKPAPGAPTPLLSLIQNGVTSCSLSRDGRTLATGGFDRTVRLWDLDTLREVRKLEDHPGPVTRVAFSPDGKRLVSSCGVDQTGAHLWDVVRGKRLAVLQNVVPTPSTQPIAFSPDGSLIVAGQSDGLLSVWESPTGEQHRGLKWAEAQLMSVAFAPDGKCIAGGGSDGSVALEAMDRGRKVTYLKKHPGAVLALAFSPDSKLIVSGEGGGKVRVSEVATGKMLREWDAHRDGAMCVIFARDGQTLLSAGGDGLLRAWDLATGKLLRETVGHRKPVLDLCLSPDGSLAVSVGDDGAVRVWTTETLRDGPPRSAEVTDRQLETLWDDLKRDDAVKRWSALTVLAVAKQTVPFLRERLKVAESLLFPDDVARLIEDLDSKSFASRDRAERELEKRGKDVEKYLRLALKRGPTLEAQRRLTRLAEKLGADQPEPLTPEQRRDALAVRALEQIGTADARKLLEQLAKGALESETTQQARRALQQLKETKAAP